MSLVSNSPSKSMHLRLEARKSFILGVQLTDHLGVPLDITGVAFSFVAKSEPFSVDDNLGVSIQRDAVVVNAAEGYLRFELQATDLLWPAGEYPFVVVQNMEGYSSVLLKGTLELIDNPEYGSLDSSFQEGAAFSNLQLKMQGRKVLQIAAGHVMAPGTHSFTTAEKNKLATIEEGAEKNVGVPPGGGLPGYVLAKLSENDHDMGWVAAKGGSGSGIDPTGVPRGWVPTADGANNWAWEEVVGGVSSINGMQGVVNISLDEIPETTERVSMLVSERDKLRNVDTAAYKKEEDFLPAAGIPASKTTSGEFSVARIPQVMKLNGISYGTAAPTGGVDGDIYLQVAVV